MNWGWASCRAAAIAEVEDGREFLRGTILMQCEVNQHLLVSCVQSQGKKEGTIIQY